MIPQLLDLAPVIITALGVVYTLYDIDVAASVANSSEMPHKHSPESMEKRWDRDIRCGYRDDLGIPTDKCAYGPKTEAERRLALIKPVILDRLNKVNTSGSVRAKRNLAVHDFDAPIRCLTSSGRKAKWNQRSGSSGNTHLERAPPSCQNNAKFVSEMEAGGMALP